MRKQLCSVLLSAVLLFCSLPMPHAAAMEITAVSAAAQRFRAREAQLFQSAVGHVVHAAEQAAQLNVQITQLETIAQLLTGNNALIGGTETYFEELQKGVLELENGAK